MEKIIELEELKKIQVGILKHIDLFCKQNDIQYFIGFGTLIGAIRHKGYIPWDDDIDIVMTRKNYEKFLRLYKEKDKSDYIAYNYREYKNFLFPFVKIGDRRTSFIEDMHNPMDIGVNIDLFPYDVLPDNERERIRFCRRCRTYAKLLQLRRVPLTRKMPLKWFVLAMFTKPFLYLVSQQWLLNTLDNYARQYENCVTQYVGDYIWGYGLPDTQQVSDIASCVNMQFEDGFFPVPMGYHKILTNIYGDYMQLPPLKKQVSHHFFIAKWK